MERNKQNKQMVRALGFVLWLGAATFAASSLTAWHSVALPVDSGHPAAQGGNARGWHLTHYLSVDCACSRALARYLVARGPVATASEEVVLIGSEDIPAESALKDGLRQRGFETAVVTPERASADEGVDGVPLLRITAPDGTERFRGGYQNLRGGSQTLGTGDYLDLTILAQLMASQPVAPVRLYGCATSRRLRSLLDPLSLRALSFPVTPPNNP